MADHPQPSRTRVALNAGLGHEQRPSVALEEGPKQVAEGPVLQVINRDRQVAIDPLVMKVIVHANDVDVLRSAAQFRAKAAREEVERLKLRMRVAAGGQDVLPLLRARDNIDGG